MNITLKLYYFYLMWIVGIARLADKELKKAPLQIRDAFDAWKNLIEQQGPRGIQSINGYWDHSLKGEYMTIGEDNGEWKKS